MEVLHAKNINSAVQSATATLYAKMEMEDKEYSRLDEELNKRRGNVLVYY